MAVAIPTLEFERQSLPRPEAFSRQPIGRVDEHLSGQKECLRWLLPCTNDGRGGVSGHPLGHGCPIRQSAAVTSELHGGHTAAECRHWVSWSSGCSDRGGPRSA